MEDQITQEIINPVVENNEIVAATIKVTTVTYIDLADKIQRRDNLMADIAISQVEVDEINALLKVNSK